MKNNEDLILGSAGLHSSVYFLYIQLNCVLNCALLTSKCKNAMTSGIRTLLLLSDFSLSFNFVQVYFHTCLSARLPPCHKSNTKWPVKFGEQLYQQKALNFRRPRENDWCRDISFQFRRFGITLVGNHSG